MRSRARIDLRFAPAVALFSGLIGGLLVVIARQGWHFVWPAHRYLRLHQRHGGSRLFGLARCRARVFSSCRGYKPVGGKFRFGGVWELFPESGYDPDSARLGIADARTAHRVCSSNSTCVCIPNRRSHLRAYGRRVHIPTNESTRLRCCVFYPDIARAWDWHSGYASCFTSESGPTHHSRHATFMTRGRQVRSGPVGYARRSRKCELACHPSRGERDTTPHSRSRHSNGITLLTLES